MSKIQRTRTIPSCWLLVAREQVSMNMKHWKTIKVTSFYFFLFFSIDSFLSDLSQQIQTKFSRLKRSLLDGKVNNRTFSKSQTYQNVMNNHWTALFCYIWRIAIRWYSSDGRTKSRMRVILTYALGRCACVLYTSLAQPEKNLCATKIDPPPKKKQKQSSAGWLLNVHFQPAACMPFHHR